MGHVLPGRQFLAPDFFDQLQLPVVEFRAVSRAGVVFMESRARPVVPAQKSLGQWDPRQNPQLLRLAKWQNLLPGLVLETVIDNLNRADVHPGRGVKLLEIVLQHQIGRQRQSEPPDFPGADLFVQHGPKRLVLKSRVAAGMKLVEVNMIRLQRPERILQLPPDRFRRPGLGLLRRTGIGMAEFGGHHPFRPPAFYAFPYD